LEARQLGLVINRADPASVEVGRHYAQRRGLKAAQILHVDLALRDQLDADQLQALRAQIDQRFGTEIQAIALAWAAPYAVECSSITAALTLGLEAGLCQRACGPTAASPLFNARTHRPQRDLGLRPTMLLAGGSIEATKALIDRSLAAEGRLGRRGAPPAVAAFATSGDRARNVRAVRYPPAGPMGAAGIEVRVLADGELGSVERAVLVQAGNARVPGLERIKLLPGALADHLTSFGGVLNKKHNHHTATDWIAAGASASHGTVSEPCNHLQKFPHPQVLLLNYVQGATAIEAYWRSVQWPQQSLFVGDPLAAAFRRRLP
jgi:uncharacterized protein (TIGR03790 family)